MSKSPVNVIGNFVLNSCIINMSCFPWLNDESHVFISVILQHKSLLTFFILSKKKTVDLWMRLQTKNIHIRNRLGKLALIACGVLEKCSYVNEYYSLFCLAEKSCCNFCFYLKKKKALLTLLSSLWVTVSCWSWWKLAILCKLDYVKLVMVKFYVRSSSSFHYFLFHFHEKVSFSEFGIVNNRKVINSFID